MNAVLSLASDLILEGADTDEPASLRHINFHGLTIMEENV